MENEVSLWTDILFARPSRLSGASRVLDLWGQFDDYNGSQNGQIADARALFADWLTVGDELVASLDHFAAKHQQEQPGESIGETSTRQESDSKSSTEEQEEQLV